MVIRDAADRDHQSITGSRHRREKALSHEERGPEVRRELMIELERIRDGKSLEQERARIVHQNMGVPQSPRMRVLARTTSTALVRSAGHVVEAIPGSVLEALRASRTTVAPSVASASAAGESDAPGGTGHHGQSPGQTAHSNGRPCTRRRNSRGSEGRCGRCPVPRW